MKTLITGLSAAALWKTLKLPGPCYGGREGQGVGDAVALRHNEYRKTDEGRKVDRKKKFDS